MSYNNNILSLIAANLDLVTINFVKPKIFSKCLFTQLLLTTHINKTNNHLSSHTIVNTKKGQQHGVGNPGPGLEQAHKCSGVKPNFLFFKLNLPRMHVQILMIQKNHLMVI
jgi:hypothetical protein